MSDEPPREPVSVPHEVELPRAFDFYELQTAEETQIHEFYERLGDGQLTTTRCRECDDLQFPPRIVCPSCMSEDLEYVGLPHEGKLHVFTTVGGGMPLGLREHDTPYIVGVVDLGPVKLSARIDNAEYEDLEIGDRVKLKIVDIEGPQEEQRAFYRFEPA